MQNAFRKRLVPGRGLKLRRATCSGSGTRTVFCLVRFSEYGTERALSAVGDPFRAYVSRARHRAWACGKRAPRRLAFTRSVGGRRTAGLVITQRNARSGDDHWSVGYMIEIWEGRMRSGRLPAGPPRRGARSKACVAGGGRGHVRWRTKERGNGGCRAAASCFPFHPVSCRYTHTYVYTQRDKRTRSSCVPYCSRGRSNSSGASATSFPTGNGEEDKRVANDCER